MGELDEKATADELASFVASGRTGRRNALSELGVESTPCSSNNNENTTNENTESNLAERFSRLDTTTEEIKLKIDECQKCSSSSQINETREKEASQT
ncbi:hypothetical protein ACQ4LE_003415 [Meloidogyne hapla]